MPSACSAKSTRGLDRVDADRVAEQAALGELDADLARHALGATRRRDIAPRIVEIPERERLLTEPRAVELVMRAAEPKSHMIGSSPCAEQAEPVELVGRPRADVGRGDVADVGHVEAQQRAHVGGVELGFDAGEAFLAQPVEAHALLPVHAHRAVRVQRHANPSLSVQTIAA